MTTPFEDVWLFCHAFGVEMADVPVSKVSPEMLRLSLRLIDEERREIGDSLLAEDMIELADGLADLMWVVIHMACVYGINLAPIWENVRYSNMAKLVDGRVLRDEGGKIMKPEGWLPPDEAHRHSLRAQGWNEEYIDG